jgi:hypothetical protein
MRVSQHYKLGRTQAGLSFVDVDIERDVALFISPRALRALPDAWGHECTSLIQNFFTQVLRLIRSKKHAEAIALLRQLREPNETHLGVSRDKSKGRGLGSNKAEDAWAALARSKAIQSGLITDLEDTVLMIQNVSSDIVSDIVTNIIRAPLISYTQTVSKQYGIPLVADIDSGPIWDPVTKSWTNRYERLPVARDDKLLLVPKIIVRYDMDYDVDKYYRKHILEHLKQAEITANTDLVHILKSGKRKGQPKVYKKDLKKKYGSGKAMVVEQTLANPELLSDYKEANKEPTKPLSHRELATAENASPPDWDRLLKAVTQLTPGRDTAGKYEKAVESLLSGLFYPYLSNPIFQDEIHGGRKRIDITYSNTARSGFFAWISQHYPSAYIHIECKNYSEDLRNPELDQMSSRFAPNRGKVGIIVCRSFADRDLWRRRCHDTAVESRGFIITLDDGDLGQLVTSRKTTLDYEEFPLLKSQFDLLVR